LRRPAKRKEKSEKKKSGEKAARNHYGDENRCTLIVAVRFATGESESISLINGARCLRVCRNETGWG
jgi:hypothetical protein